MFGLAAEKFWSNAASCYQSSATLLRTNRIFPEKYIPSDNP